MAERFSEPFRGYDVLSKWDTSSFNDTTRAVLRDRLDPPPRRFFSDSEWATLVALCDRVMPQPEREQPVAIAAWIDADRHTDRPTGTRKAAMPEDGAAWRQGLAALNAEAEARHCTTFSALKEAAQDALLRAVDREDLAAPQAWNGLPAREFFRGLALTQIVSVYYAHPAAMSEIGYGGPASPRGYVRLDADRFDPWEAGPGRWGDEDTHR